MVPALPPLFRVKDIVFGVLFLFFSVSFRAYAPWTLEGIAFRVVYFWLLFLAVRHWWAYRRRVAPQIKAHQDAVARQAAQQAQEAEQQRAAQALQAAQQEASQTLADSLAPHLGQGYTLTPLVPAGVRLTCPSGTLYHVYALLPQDTVSPQRPAVQQGQLARSERATLLRLDDGGGAAEIHGQDVVLHTGPHGLAEQVSFWERAAQHEQAVRQRGRDVETQAVQHLAGVFPGWLIRLGVLMRRGGDVDAVLTRPDGRVFSVDVKSHRGTPELVDSVSYLGRSEKGAVQRQLQLQAQETGGQAVCWQPEAGYGVLRLDTLLFVGGDGLVLREALTDVR